MKKVIVALLAALCLSGCVTTGTTPVKADPAIIAGNSLYAAQQTIVNIRRNVVPPCKAGTIPKDVCAQISEIYEQSKPVYDLAVDAELLYMTSPTPGNKAEVDAKTAKFIEFIANASVIAVKYSVKETK